MIKVNRSPSNKFSLKKFLSTGCSGAMCSYINEKYEAVLPLEEQAAFLLAGGMMQYGYQCGQIWGAVLSAGAQAHRIYGPGTTAQVQSIQVASNLVDLFRDKNRHVDCLELTDMDETATGFKMFVYFLVKGGTFRCFMRGVQYSKAAFQEMERTFVDSPSSSLPGPVSCAAIVAQKMGASEQQITMAAGLAGGIGLSGGACGALGAAIWVTGMNSSRAQEGQLDYKDPSGLALMEKFIKATDCEFRCSEITGRKFENVEDHAAYLQENGCEKLLEILAMAEESEQVPVS